MTHRKAFLCLHHIPIYDGNEQLLSLKVGQRETEPSRHHYPGSFIVIAVQRVERTERNWTTLTGHAL